MAKSKTNPKVDFFFSENKKWQEELERLRDIILDCGLTEELKWGTPCYTMDGSNIVLIHAFKDYCAVLFFKGALIKDTKGILIQQTKNVQAARQVRYTSLQEVVKSKASLKSLIKEAIKIEKAGLKVPLKKTKEFEMPDEFKKRLSKDAALKTAFKALTPGKEGTCSTFLRLSKLQHANRELIKLYQKFLKGKGLDD